MIGLSKTREAALAAARKLGLLPHQKYAQGGYIGPPTPPSGLNPIQLSRGCVMMTYSSYKALGEEGCAELFPNTDIELVFSADEVREFGQAALEKIQAELRRQDGETA